MQSKSKIFLTVLEEGSFTKAATVLGYSQSAISQTIKTIEEELGTTLLSRSREGLSLTADGEEFLPYIRAIVAAEDDLDSKIREMQGLEQGVIKIGTFTSISRNLLPPLMHDFRKLYPNVRFELFQGEYNNIQDWILDGTIDFGFVAPNTVTGLETQPFLSDTMMACLPMDHPLAQKKCVSLADLTNDPFIELIEGTFSVTRKVFKDYRLTPNIVYSVYDDYTILEMVKQGFGISMLYKLVLTGYGKEIALRPIIEPFERSLDLAWRDYTTLPIATKRFIEYIKQYGPNVIDHIREHN